MKQGWLAGVLFCAILLIFPSRMVCAAGAQAASSDTRGRYLAGQGIITPQEEVYTDSYIASINYHYPMPESEMGVYLYNSSGQISRGQEGILHIGIQGRSMSFDQLPPMNLVLVIDCSSSMNDEDKIAWVKESAAIFIKKVRPVDYAALVSFSDSAQVLFPSTRMDSPEKKQRFLDAVQSLRGQGGTDLEKGLTAGYEQVLTNYRQGSVNRVLFFSDGTEFSSRLNQAGAQSGDVRLSLIWNNRNDLDLHVITPRGEEIFYGSPRDSTGGFLDVDMNVRGETSKPVENIFWAQGKAPQGRYQVIVQNFAYHERGREPIPFQVEIKNGSEYSHFEGVVSGTGKSSNAQVAAFEYKGSGALQREKALIYQLAESYRLMGITTTTLGVGVGFDVEMMQQLAIEGGGSSRFISGRDEMEKLFDTEFERMVALVASDVEMSLDFAPGFEILETWGYQHHIKGSRISYKLSGLHLGDYETILIRYRLPPALPEAQRQNAGTETELARFSVQGLDLLEKPLPPLEKSARVVITDNAASGISSGMVLYSGTMLHFAESLKEIGGLYYAGQDDLSALSRLERELGRTEPSAAQRDRMNSLKENFLSRLEAALKMTRDGRLEMENAKLRLDDREAFTHELEILAKYDAILSKELADSGGRPAVMGSSRSLPSSKELADSGGRPAGDYAGLGSGLAGSGPTDSGGSTGSQPPRTRPEDLGALQNRLSALFAEIGLSFPAGQRSVAAMAPFSQRGVEDRETPLLAFINESALVSLSGRAGLSLVERSRLDAVRAEQNLLRQGILDTDQAIEAGKLLGAQYMITGQVIPMSSQVIIFARVIHVETGEIISAAQVFVERTVLGDLI